MRRALTRAPLAVGDISPELIFHFYFGRGGRRKLLSSSSSSSLLGGEKVDTPHFST